MMMNLRSDSLPVRLGLCIHVFAATIAGLILLLRPSLLEHQSFYDPEAMRDFGKGAIGVALVGAAILSGLARAGDLLISASGRLVTHFFGILATCHSVLVALQFGWMTEGGGGAPMWLATVFWAANKRFNILKFKFKFPSNFRTFQGSFSAVSKPNLARKYAFESSRRDLHNALLCTALNSQFFKNLL